ncbi:hypothetical protein N7540_011503 [Penicillium herquei]|nr:hypothetical protein N7540_011503 [Penicillium herquei]
MYIDATQYAIPTRFDVLTRTLQRILVLCDLPSSFIIVQWKGWGQCSSAFLTAAIGDAATFLGNDQCSHNKPGLPGGNAGGEASQLLFSSSSLYWLYKSWYLVR